MPDYGHPLRFGSFITPVNSPSSRPVQLAVLSEQLGLDLVTFQDHPYQPSFLDTWTLLSWAGAQTERVQLSGNVLNLPLRQPAVLARAAASLDLLSGGRVSLGIGATASSTRLPTRRAAERSSSVLARAAASTPSRCSWSTPTTRTPSSSNCSRSPTSPRCSTSRSA
jgi:alkanesulfonate monooxygenase SsuD/methylene tetrahydromethanopterin reductase-like flavin-dependent oxidoreductase (luciferase family)